MTRHTPTPTLFPYTTLFRSWRRIRRHKWLILSLVIIVTTLATIQAYRIKEWYVSAAVLEIGKENTISLKSGDLTLRSEEHKSELQSHSDLVCRLLLEKKNR